MNPFGQLYSNLVSKPLLNLLQIFFDLTNDIGYSIIILAILINLLMWPLFIKTYLNGQKLKYLQPKIKEIQTKYKDDREKLVQETIKFNRRHGISNGSFILVLLLQILIASGLYILTRNVSDGQELTGLYEAIFNRSTATFDTIAFGFLDIAQDGRDYIALPILNAILSFVYGFYNWKLTPKLPEVPKKKETKKSDSPFDPEATQKAMQVQMMVFLPVFLFFINLGLPVGVSIYFATVNLMSLVRQVFVTQFYTNHITTFLQDLSKTDPEFDEDTANITDAITANQKTATKELSEDKSRQTAKKSVKKQNKSKKPTTKKKGSKPKKKQTKKKRS